MHNTKQNKEAENHCYQENNISTGDVITFKNAPNVQSIATIKTRSVSREASRSVSREASGADPSAEPAKKNQISDFINKWQGR